MRWFQILLALVLVDFLGLTGWVIYEYGYLGFFELANANWATRLLMADLVISLSLIAGWMIRDARERGSNQRTRRKRVAGHRDRDRRQWRAGSRDN